MQKFDRINRIDKIQKPISRSVLIRLILLILSKNAFRVRISPTGSRRPFAKKAPGIMRTNERVKPVTTLISSV